jgi:hypothetical protein
VSKIDAPDTMLMTDPDALTTENALVGIVDEELMAGIYGQGPGYEPEPLQLQLESLPAGNPLQLAVSILGTIAAIKMMVREKKLKGSTAQSLHSGSSGMYHHTIFNELATGSHRRPSSLDLHEAEPATTERQIGFPNSAEIGNIDAIVKGCPEEPLPLAGSNLPAVNGQDNFFGYGSLQNNTYVTLSALASRAIMTAVWHKPVHFTITTFSMVTRLTRDCLLAALGTEGEGL